MGLLWGTSLSEATKAPSDITLPPAVMSEATTMGLSRQMARPGVGGWGWGAGAPASLVEGQASSGSVSQMAGHTQITAN